MTVSEWADSERYLSPEYCPEPGKWHTDSAPFQRGIMDAFNDRRIHTIVIVASSQVGKTEILKNVVGYTIDKDPAPILMVQPTLDIAEAWSKDRLKPMVRDTPALADRINFKSRDGDNTILHKTFRGGHITIAGANSPSSLASRPIRILLLDEVDRYPASAGDEGDPVNLARKRTTRFWNRKVVMVSTPTIKDQSRIIAAYSASDQRVFEVPCPHCDEPDILKFAHLVRPYDDAPGEEWEYFCPHCGAAIDETSKMEMLRAGQWVAKGKSNGIAGFWINELYSPWVSWGEMVDNFLEAKKLPDTLKTFINTSLAETWDEDREGESIDGDTLAERTEEYPAEVPKEVYMLTAAVDVQDDRLELEVLGWGMEKETWSIEHRILWGDPASSDIWDQLNDCLTRYFEHELGGVIRITIAVIDAGGHFTENVYQYVKKKAKERRRIYAVRGHSVRNQPILAKVSRNNDYRVKVFYLGTDTAKELIYSYLKINRAGPGFMHHPQKYDDEYFEQLTSERKLTAYERGKTVTKWILPKGKRNEALDLKVYNFAAYRILRPDMAKVRDRFLAKIEKKSDHEPESEKDNTREKPKSAARPARKKPARRRSGGFAKNW